MIVSLLPLFSRYFFRVEKTLERMHEEQENRGKQVYKKYKLKQ